MARPRTAAAHTTDPTPGAPARAVPSDVMGQIQQGISEVYLAEKDEFLLPNSRGTVEYDQNTDEVIIRLNMQTPGFEAESDS